MNSTSSIQCIPAFDDNYIWLIEHNSEACVVDPGDSQVILDYLLNKQLQLEFILITHWHPDHIGGIDALLAVFPDVTIYAPNSLNIPTFTQHISQNDSITIFDLKLDIIEVPGHTLEHISYYAAFQAILFCGDTLFAGGCGRVFEGTHKQMYHSLQTLAHLNPSTKIYCAHEYTLENLAFCLAVEPENQAIHSRIAKETLLREQGQATIPTLLDTELKTNVFLRCQPDIVRVASLTLPESPDEIDVFTALRQWKNDF